MKLNLNQQVKLTGISVMLLVLVFFCFSFWGTDLNIKKVLKQTISFVIVNAAFVSLFFQIPIIRIRNVLVFAFNAVLLCLCFIKFSFAYLYNSEITESTWFIIFETNTSEVAEYIETYFSSRIFFLWITFLLLGLFFFKTFFLNQKVWLKNLRVNNLSRFVLATITVLYFFQTKERFFDYDILQQFYSSIKEYRLYKSELNNSLSHSFVSSKQSNTICSDNSSPQIHVVIVGESLTNHHMSLYGYSRKTNPRLEKIKEELLVFENVISPHAYTIESLQKILTLSCHEKQNPKENFSVIQLANEVNYDTYWISNQKPVGVWENITTITANAAKKKVWLEMDNFRSRIEDGELLPVLQEKLNELNSRKVIFVHLMGVHSTYYKRYPEDFNYFKGVPPKSFSKTQEAFQRINDYDNAVRYNDYVIDAIISMVKSKNVSSTVTYFSDHGEEVYESKNFVGHNEDVGTSAMYEIPMLFWFSEKYLVQNNLTLDGLQGYQQRPYVLEDFPHTFADMLKIKSNRINFEKSILSPNFIYKERHVGSGKLYQP